MEKKVYYGNDAVKIVEAMEGRELTPIEKRTVILEGFVPEVYTDTKGIKTFGVGQTGKWINKSFGESFSHHEDLTRDMIKDYDVFPEYLKAELVQATYRGDLGGSPETRKLLNKGLYKEASKEFLKNEEYKSEETPQSIKDRMLSVAEAIENYGFELENQDMPTLKEYVVQDGDSLYSIAKQTGRTVGEIVDQNKITNLNQIQAGQSLLL